MSESVIVSKAEDIAVVMLDRRQAFNALDLQMADRLASSLVTLAADHAVRGVVISGHGKAFCAGGDLKWVRAFERGAPAAFHELAGRFHVAIAEIRRMPKPVIAAVNGVAAGGGFSLALACDFRVLARSAVLQQAYTSSGLCIDGGGTFTLPRLVGLARALQIAAFDPPISAEQALAWGLATTVAEDGQAVRAALDLARDLGQRSMKAFAAAKQLLTDSFDTPFETQLERERAMLSECGGHADGQEGMAAFAAKRKPRFGRPGQGDGSPMIEIGGKYR